MIYEPFGQYHWYITMRVGRQKIHLILGPLESPFLAMDLIPAARMAMMKRSPWSVFYTYGVALVPTNQPGLLETNP